MWTGTNYSGSPQCAPTPYIFLSALRMQADSAAGEEILLGWLSWTPINSHRELRSPPKIANVNRWIFYCNLHSHIAAVPSALRYREVVLRRGYRGVHARFAAQLPPFSLDLTLCNKPTKGYRCRPAA